MMQKAQTAISSAECDLLVRSSRNVALDHLSSVTLLGTNVHIGSFFNFFFSSKHTCFHHEAVVNYKAYSGFGFHVEQEN